MLNSDFGFTIKKAICDKYKLVINEQTKKQFESAFCLDYYSKFNNIVDDIFKDIKSIPKESCIFEKNKDTGIGFLGYSFILKNGKTLDIRSCKSSDKISPKVVGQAGLSTLNELFETQFGKEIKNKEDIKNLFMNNFDYLFPIYVDYFFSADITVFVFLDKYGVIQYKIVYSSEISNIDVDKEDFTFSRCLEKWNESNTVYYKNCSIAEIQIHKNRGGVKFRFNLQNLLKITQKIKETNETLGISAEVAICLKYGLGIPKSYEGRFSEEEVNKILPYISECFSNLPKPIKSTGSLKGSRGKKSKCAYDFILDGNKTLSLKTNKGRMVCPPDVGQPGNESFLYYFGRVLNIDEINYEIFKYEVFLNIEKMLPIYFDHLFDSNYLVWIRQLKNEYTSETINKNDVKKICWERSKISFSKKSAEDWNESLSVSYCGLSIGEFQLHKNRVCYKFRFNLENLLNIILPKS